MTNKEIKLQLALGTLPEEEFYELASSSSDPIILKALAKAFSKQIIDNKFYADNLTTAFLNNPHMTQKLKNFVLLSQMLHRTVDRFFALLPGKARSKEEIQKQLEKLSKELFDD